jgi:hypothetical protein
MELQFFGDAIDKKAKENETTTIENIAITLLLFPVDFKFI